MQKELKRIDDDNLISENKQADKGDVITLKGSGGGWKDLGLSLIHICGTCAGECPVGAISAGASQYEIDGSACVDCGTCAGVCPTGAIAQG